MPIGTGKVGLFGGIAIEAGSETFNAPGTFTVPADLKTVYMSGNGSTANAGNPGNPGGDGIGGDGGDAAFFPATYISPNAVSRTENRPCGGGIAASQRTDKGLGTGPPAAPFAPFLNPPGGPGNPGNPGGVTSALGSCWTGGSAGTGGTGGVCGSYGVPGASANYTGVPYTPFETGTGNQPVAVGATSYAGGGGVATGGGGGYIGSRRYGANLPYCCDTIRWSIGGAWAGSGGGGAGTFCDPSSPPAAPNWPGVNGGNAGIFKVNPAVAPNPYRSPSNCTNVGVGNPFGGGLGAGGTFTNTVQGSGSSDRGNVAQNAINKRGGGGGGGGGGYSASTCAPGVPNPCNSLRPVCLLVGYGAGGGGSGSVGNPGSGAGNPGATGTPATYNCVAVSTGCYPVQVGTGGQIIISWNDQ